MSPPHDHTDHHCCHHAPKDFGKAFLIGVILNTGFVGAEVFWGLKANSLSLLADAGHNASDVLALLLAWGATVLAKRLPCDRFTYGMRSSSIIVSLTNAVLLMLVVGGIGWESIQRFMNPEPAIGSTMMVVAGIGVVINGITAGLFMSGRKHDLNIKGAYLHMLADALISLGVVVSGALILKTGWLWLDPLTSLIISILIIWGTWGLLKESMVLVLHAVPKGIDPLEVKKYLQGLKDVREVHDLHVWAMSTTEVASSIHLVMKHGHPGDLFIKDIAKKLEHDFQINHTTIQIEIGDTGDQCPLASDTVV